MDNIPIRDIHLPPIPGWWPPAPGWWLVLFILIIFFIFIQKLRKKLKYHSMQRKALDNFLRIQNEYLNGQNKTLLLQELSILLRRICMTYAGRQRVAGLINEQWLHQLDVTSSKPCLSPEICSLLISGPYQKQPEFEADELLRCCENWIYALPDEIENKGTKP